MRKGNRDFFGYQRKSDPAKWDSPSRGEKSPTILSTYDRVSSQLTDITEAPEHKKPIRKQIMADVIARE